VGTSSLTIRPALPGDAADLLELQLALDRESEFMLLSAGERPDDPAPVAARLRSIDEKIDSSYVLLAQGNGRLTGYVDVSILPYRRGSRTGYVVTGVRADAQGNGVGRALMHAATGHAREIGLRRLELTVMTYNHAAIALYLGSGFQVEGLRLASIDHHGIPIDEYYMGLVLEAGTATV
jgi:RimJ/RimL family protein N-acetyltransferase